MWFNLQKPFLKKVYIYIYMCVCVRVCVCVCTHPQFGDFSSAKQTSKDFFNIYCCDVTSDPWALAIQSNTAGCLLKFLMLSCNVSSRFPLSSWFGSVAEIWGSQSKPTEATLPTNNHKASDWWRPLLLATKCLMHSSPQHFSWLLHQISCYAPQTFQAIMDICHLPESPDTSRLTSRPNNSLNDGLFEISLTPVKA